MSNFEELYKLLGQMDPKQQELISKAMEIVKSCEEEKRFVEEEKFLYQRRAHIAENQPISMGTLGDNYEIRNFYYLGTSDKYHIIKVDKIKYSGDVLIIDKTTGVIVILIDFKSSSNENQVDVKDIEKAKRIPSAIWLSFVLSAWKLF